MEKIEFDKIEIENFGPYKGIHSIEFSKDEDKNVTLIMGRQIGTGKTILNHFITYLIFGLKKKEKLIRYAQRKKIAEKKPFKVGGKLTFEIYDNSLNSTGNFQISRYFTYTKGKITNLEFNIKKDGEIKIGEEFEIFKEKLEKNIFHHGIRPFLFIQGERMDDLFSNDEIHSKKVKNFTIQLSDLPVLKKYKQYLTKFEALVQRKLAKEQKKIDKINRKNVELKAKTDELEDKKEKISIIESEIDELDKDTVRLGIEIEKYAQQAAEGQKLYDIEQDVLSKRNHTLIFAEQRSKFIKKNFNLLYLEKPMKMCLEDLLEKEKRELWPKNIDRRTALSLKKNLKVCEVCGREWDEMSRTHLENIVKQLPDDFDNSVLINFRGTLESKLNQIEGMKNGLKEVEQNFRNSNKEYKKLQNKLTSLNRDIEKKYSQEEWLKNFKLKNQQRDTKVKSQQKKIEKKNRMNLEIEDHFDEKGKLIVGLENEIKGIKTEIITLETRSNKEFFWSPHRDRINGLLQITESCINKFSAELIDQVEKNATEIFHQLHWNPDIFRNVKFKIIEENDGWKVYLEGAESTGEVHLVGMSYILGLSLAIEVKIPLFIDAPFVIFDKKTKSNIASKLPHLLKGTQLILSVKDEELESVKEVIKKFIGRSYILEKLDIDESRIVSNEIVDEL